MAKPYRNLFDKNNRNYSQELTCGIPISKIMNLPMELDVSGISYTMVQRAGVNNFHNPKVTAGMDAQLAQRLDNENIRPEDLITVDGNGAPVPRNDVVNAVCEIQQRLYGGVRYCSCVSRSTMGLLAENKLFKHLCACFDEVKIMGFNLSTDLMNSVARILRSYMCPVGCSSVTVQYSPVHRVELPLNEYPQDIDTTNLPDDQDHK